MVGVNPKPYPKPHPGRSLQERLRLLSVLVVGGGPTGVEFCGELGDFIRSVRAHDPGRTPVHMWVSSYGGLLAAGLIQPSLR